MRAIAGAALALLIAGMAWAEGESAGDFDYYVMALSWSPTWCALEGDDRGAPECRDGAGLAFTLHGLWPQHEQGWPSYCRTGAADPTRAESAAMEGIMGSAGLAWYQWKKHGRCSGLTAREYYATARAAFGRITQPAVFGGLNRQLSLPAAVVEDAFLEANPGLAADQITVTCDQGLIAEVRVCLTKDLTPRRCGADVIRDCRLRDAGLPPLR